MSALKTGHAKHDAVVTVAEATRQAAVSAAGNSQASVRAAEIAFYRSALTSAARNGLPTANFITALRELGANP